jgi:hypothetical protein
MNIDRISLLVAGFSGALLLITTFTVDSTIFPTVVGYWTRFLFFGRRYGIAIFVVWSVFVLIMFR